MMSWRMLLQQTTTLAGTNLSITTCYQLQTVTTNVAEQPTLPLGTHMRSSLRLGCLQWHVVHTFLPFNRKVNGVCRTTLENTPMSVDGVVTSA